jgi:hypothetical protein
LPGTALWLFVSQNLEVEGDKTHTASYAYRISTADEKTPWLVRWEYLRQPPRPDYEYPLAHMHVNSSLLDESAEALLHKPAPHLHLPTARVGLELVLWHLLAEWGVTAKTDDWREVLEKSLKGFRDRQTTT